MTAIRDQLSKEYLTTLLNRTDHTGMHAIGIALVRLFELQTVEEQEGERTYYQNGQGFTGFDGEIGASMAKQYQKRGSLTDRQLAVWRKPHGKSSKTKIGKYVGQLLGIAIDRVGRELPYELEVLITTKQQSRWCKKNLGHYGVDWWYNDTMRTYRFASEALKATFILTWK